VKAWNITTFPVARTKVETNTLNKKEIFTVTATMKAQDHLMKQDAATVDPSKLTSLSPEVVRSFETHQWAHGDLFVLRLVLFLAHVILMLSLRFEYRFLVKQPSTLELLAMWHTENPL
jgi:hypothetical protein